MFSRRKSKSPPRSRRLQFDSLEERVNFALPDFPTTAALTAPVDVSSNSSAEIGDMDVAMFPDGSYVTVFSQGSDIFARKFDARKVAVGNQFTVATAGSGRDLSLPRVAASANGNFVVVYEDFTTSDSDEDVFFKLFSSTNGTLASGQVNSTDNAKDQHAADVAMDNAGNFVVTYEHDYDVDDTDVYYRVYNSSGTALATATTVSSASGAENEFRPSVGFSRDGSRFGIAWQESPDTGPDTVKISLYTKSGSTVALLSGSGGLIVPQTGSGTNSMESPSVAGDDDGDIAIAWIEDISGNERVMKRTYTPSGFGGNSIEIVPEATTIGDPDLAVGRDAYREYAIAYENGTTSRVAGTMNGGTTTFDLPVNYNLSTSRNPAVGMSGHAFVVGFEERLSTENQQKVQAFGRAEESGRAGDDVGGYVASNGAIWAGRTDLGQAVPMDNEYVTTYSPSIVWKDFVTGDFNNDGFDEVAARANSTGQWFVTDYNGTTAWATWAPTAGWVDVQIADVNGDNRDDIIGRTATGQWWAARSTGTGFTNVYLGSWVTSITWRDVRVGDFNDDNKIDIVGRNNANGQWWMGRAGGTTSNPTITNVPLGIWSPSLTWVDVLVGDFDGDGDHDLAGRANGNWWIGKSNGSTITNQFWGSWSPSVTWTDVKVGDFDLDGRDDILGRIANSGSWWVARSTGTTFATTNWGGWAGTGWKNTQIIDVNADGRSDILSWNSATGQWWAGISTGTTFKTYLWGAWTTSYNWTEVRGGQF